MRSGRQQSTRNPIHLYGSAPLGGSRADQRTSQRNTRYNHATRLRPAPQHPKTHVLNCLPAASGHKRGSTPNSPPAATAGARRPGATRRPGAEAFAHSTSTPLHFNRPGLGPGFLPARPYPATRYRAALGPPAPPISAREAPRKSGIRRKSNRRLRRPAPDTPSKLVGTFYNSAVRRDTGGSAAPVRASPAPVQPQKPKAVSGGWSRPSGRRAWRGQHREGTPKSPPIEVRTEIPSVLAPAPTSTPS